MVRSHPIRCPLPLSSLLSSNARYLEAQKRKSKKDRFNGISREGIERKREKV